MATTKTKPSVAFLEAPEAPEEQPIFGHYEELLTELEAAKARIAELESGEQLNQGLWLQKTPPETLDSRAKEQGTWEANKAKRGVTANGTSYIKFGAQYGSLNKKTGSRSFGAWKNFVAYGLLADEINEFFRTEDRLVRIGAYERPWHGNDGTRNTEWVVVSFQPIARLDATTPVSEPEVPFSAEPTAAEVAF